MDEKKNPFLLVMLLLQRSLSHVVAKPNYNFLFSYFLFSKAGKYAKSVSAGDPIYLNMVFAYLVLDVNKFHQFINFWLMSQVV